MVETILWGIVVLCAFLVLSALTRSTARANREHKDQAAWIAEQQRKGGDRGPDL